MQNSPYTLVVVHMQGHLSAARYPPTVAGVQRMIRQAINDSAAIIFTWFPYYSPSDEAPCPPPLSELTELINGYERGVCIEHFGSDGSWSVLHECARRHWPPDVFRVCGVNTEACVYETACGLARSGATVEVWLKACNTNRSLHDFERQFLDSGLILVDS